mmetsp:Transcript_4507/g.5993  ORF Transcript_4507/g.5993 Transcript_4507/m.5993 type:complete len:190 (-) Transcript_4507:307-876(-)
MGSVCCCWWGVKADEEEKEVLRILSKICDAYESAQVIAILGPEGSILIDFWVDGSATGTQRHVADHEGKSGVFWTLKKAAEQFGALMNCSYTPIVHIRGQRYLVSCFHLGTHMLSLVSAPADPTQFNTTEADKKIKPVLQELELIIASGKASKASMRLQSSQLKPSSREKSNNSMMQRGTSCSSQYPTT